MGNCNGLFGGSNENQSEETAVKRINKNAVKSALEANAEAFAEVEVIEESLKESGGKEVKEM